jgi:hypothetical protein
VGAIVLGSCAAADAHHSFFGEFDFHQPITVTGTVVQVEWRNPHTLFVLEVKDRKGTVTKWTFSAAASASLVRMGITETTIKVGDTLKVDGFRAVDGSFYASAGAVTPPGRKRIFIGSLEEPTPF